MNTGDRVTRGPKITILTSLFRADDDVEQFLANITSTDGFDRECVLAIDDIATSHRDPQRVRVVIANYERLHPGIKYHARLEDPGLYELWNAQIRRSRLPYLTFGCLDDRRNPSVFCEHIAALDAEPGLDVVCGPTLATATPGETWERNTAFRTYSGSFNWQTSALSSLGSKTEFGLNDLFRRAPNGEWIDSDCLPHCMPMWRRSLHDRFGFFDEHQFGPLADWEFWIRCASGGARFRLLSSYAGLYLVNPQSHNRRVDTNETKRRIISAYSLKQGN